LVWFVFLIAPEVLALTGPDQSILAVLDTQKVQALQQEKLIDPIKELHSCIGKDPRATCGPDGVSWAMMPHFDKPTGLLKDFNGQTIRRFEDKNDVLSMAIAHRRCGEFGGTTVDGRDADTIPIFDLARAKETYSGPFEWNVGDEVNIALFSVSIWSGLFLLGCCSC